MVKIKKYLVYSTSACPYCDLLKKWLDSHQIDYESVNLSEDPSRGQEMIQKTGQMGVPVSIVTFDDDVEKIIIGFDQSRLEGLLGINF